MQRRRAIAVLAALVLITVLAPTSTAGAARKVDLRLDQVQVIGTHNSYHVPPRANLHPLDIVSISQAPLKVQLEDWNVRSFELDAYNGDDFDVFHGLFTDEKSNCPRMARCLEIIDRWSRRHRKYVPITILVEPKQLPTSPLHREARFASATSDVRDGVDHRAVGRGDQA